MPYQTNSGFQSGGVILDPQKSIPPISLLHPAPCTLDGAELRIQLEDWLQILHYPKASEKRGERLIFTEHLDARCFHEHHLINKHFPYFVHKENWGLDWF